MAIWFALIYFSYVVIFLVTGRYNAIAPQALWLMGISATSGVAAIAVDVVKESPADAVNRGLRALAFQTYTDVQAVRREISDRERELKANPPPANAQQLTLEIRDRNLALTAYGNAIRPYVSEGWYKDLTTDLNGAALHRVQVLVWTITLGVVFTIEVFSNLAMPQFDSSLLLLLGISNASYVGFKYPEPQQ